MNLIVRSSLWSVVIPAALLLAGCDSTVSTEDHGTIDPLVGRVLFRLAERHGCSGGGCEPTIALQMETEAIYPCCNYGIASSVWRCRDNVTVYLRGIDKTDWCLTAIGPARAAVPLDLAAGNYSLRFVLDDAVSTYALSITDDAIATGAGDSTFMSPQAPLTWRYPRNTFCYLCGTTTATSWVCDAFADSMLSAGRFEEFAFPDSGAIPYPRASSGHYHDAPARYFRYAAEADYDTAGAILGRYSRRVVSQHSGIGLSLGNWRNVWFRSWMMN